ncbi:Phytocyanin domain containing protein [Trema orientale]|uniref:Phytocyanin domain containing protein n=1 Tax=Trema orientale TaxID=63057 RepID=A0A2P5EHY8_TREOI|nr:Phytocyanin domain containing protein [Trema orientale]
MGTATIAVNLTVIASLLMVSTAAAYTNHTVGGNAGWFFNATTNTTAANYSSWAATQTFSLGDFLLFKTNSNQTVIETYNKTTYQSCAYDDSDSDDTFQYGGGDQHFGEALTIEVPLLLEGSTYYFSSAGDGVQCQRGMAFEINVAHGAGLPESLNRAPPPPYNEPPGPDSAQSPDTLTGSKPSGNGAFRIGGGLCALLPLLMLLF